ncbi:hypothetical protein DMP23_12735 [Amycolatopsis sp. A1MSW2902]
MNSASRNASSTPSTASEHSRWASSSAVPVASNGFQDPDAASAARSSTASSRWATRPNSRPASASGARLPGRPAITAVCANAADDASSAGSVASNGESPARIARSSSPWRPTTSVRTAVSKPISAPVRPPCAAQRRATSRAAPATGRRAKAPSRSATWSATFAEARTSDTAAASRAPSPTATDAGRIDRSGHGPAARRGPLGVCASTSADTISAS